MKPRNPLFQKCLAYLESLPHLQAAIAGEPYLKSNVAADGQLTLKRFNTSANYICEIKTELTEETFEDVAKYFFYLKERLSPGERPLLITRRLSNWIIDRLLDEDIEFIDVEGNVYLNSPGIYILVREPNLKEKAKKSLEITPDALQVMYALLSRSENFYITGNKDKIAEFSGTSVQIVESTLEKLENSNYIRTRGQELEIANYVRLLERWELGYIEELRDKLLIGTFSPIARRTFEETQLKIRELAYSGKYLIGGELGAAIITQNLYPIGATLHLYDPDEYRELAVNLKIKPDPEGKIIFLQGFGCYEKFKDFPNSYLVYPLLIHAELVSTGNSRLKEVAENIYSLIRYQQGLQY